MAKRCVVCRRGKRDPLIAEPICWTCYELFRKWNFGRLPDIDNAIGWAAKRVWRLARQKKKGNHE